MTNLAGQLRDRESRHHRALAATTPTRLRRPWKRPRAGPDVDPPPPNVHARPPRRSMSERRDAHRLLGRCSGVVQSVAMTLARLRLGFSPRCGPSRFPRERPEEAAGSIDESVRSGVASACIGRRLRWLERPATLVSSQAVGSPLGNQTEVDVHVVDGKYECAVSSAILEMPDVPMPDVRMPGGRDLRRLTHRPILRIEGVEVHRCEVGQ